MRLALIGYGKMGRAIEALAPARGHEVAATVDLKDRAAKFRRLTRQAVEAADVCIEFTTPHAALGNILRLCQLGKRVVTGTTGWYDHLDELAAVVAKKKATVLYGANFSIGVNLFYRLVERAAELFGALDDRDFYVAEAHHRAKLDSPSGTAKRLAEIVLRKSRAKKRTLQRLDGPIAEDQLQIVSTRAGWITGVHRVGIEGPHDSIVIEHQARSRDTFADGALRAAEWIVSAPPGLYRFEEILDQLLHMAP